MSKLIPVVMAGGTGSRLWPLSRESFPKQFLSIDDSGFSLLQQTLQRLSGLDGVKVAAPLVICNENHRFLVAEQLREIDQLATNIILEPVGRNTAPAVALAAHLAAEEDEDSILLVLAADHLIKKVDNFHSAIKTAIQHASEDHLVTFGIIPEHPETGYGYIKRGSALSDECFKVDAFVEKPSLDKAVEYLASGEFSWNSGMFMFKTDKFLQELQQFSPEIFSTTQQSVADSQRDMNFIRVDQEIFKHCPSDSIDYAVMEKTGDAVVIPIDAGWSDVGSWSSLWDVSEKDHLGNVNVGEIISIDSTDNYISSESALVATIGLDNLIVVNTNDALLIASKDRVQDVKKVVDELKKRKLHHFRKHSSSYQPWGKISEIDNGNYYQVKKIVVRPSEGLSVQRHHHRSEYWVVVSGTAKVQVDDKEFYLTENQSTFIPAGSVHTLENRGKIDLEMIEVRSGQYLGDDDIERLHDRYGRK
ncbi:mannose-1-phosphate guanylyltransferase/mannose-6-phosphate isomerase [Serratia liquefaciens]|uniref:mannose-1-phosphate guanylyltransferase/mannose-6-phosphate isomerase n=1 Tax=Serratia liquefaciens TaxID=614 RepID=UPI0003586434|nr:mannose-1-phosphate guanylyltransferase/mannose-6-phosphate isomerase [Serratia liquefaciens]AGQ30307.1 mannose-1-phosphate guanyltransferase [Serratia liquefaciens ATCC 27592]CAI0911025.1 Mannose-1-phosphate guanylyltransferase rfbM [Serratia liquefaciens]CAI2120104.1 Mannose-1-phosphate guanylyltransferase rfbM [Serratia liquefaciens]CAI2473422.1 Mannose-1-phosphate guanylyltransferase rfbM [Serratia liquefaciens]HEJ7997101.1 mannose-1-phosphate guanylyltransferase/mannose-6-phosphate iso